MERSAVGCFKSIINKIDGQIKIEITDEILEAIISKKMKNLQEKERKSILETLYALDGKLSINSSPDNLLTAMNECLQNILSVFKLLAPPQQDNAQLDTPPLLTMSLLSAPCLEEPCLEEPCLEEPCLEAPGLETPRLETPRLEALRLEALRLETPRLETPRLETPDLNPKIILTPPL